MSSKFKVCNLLYYCRCTDTDNQCDSDACVENQGVCVNDAVRARCDCNLGFSGYRCEIDISKSSATIDGPISYVTKAIENKDTIIDVCRFLSI